MSALFLVWTKECDIPIAEADRGVTVRATIPLRTKIEVSRSSFLRIDPATKTQH
jgi:hypothetical protein